MVFGFTLIMRILNLKSVIFEDFQSSLKEAGFKRIKSEAGQKNSSVIAFEHKTDNRISVSILLIEEKQKFRIDLVEVSSKSEFSERAQELHGRITKKLVSYKAKGVSVRFPEGYKLYQTGLDQGNRVTL